MNKQCGLCKKPYKKGQLKFKVKGRTSLWYRDPLVCYKCKKKNI